MVNYQVVVVYYYVLNKFKIKNLKYKIQNTKHFYFLF